MNVAYIEDLFRKRMIEMTRQAILDFDKQFARPEPILENILR